MLHTLYYIGLCKGDIKTWVDKNELTAVTFDDTLQTDLLKDIVLHRTNNKCIIGKCILTLRYMGVVVVVYFPLLKISLGNPYLTVLDLSFTFCCGCPYKKNQQFLFYPLKKYFRKASSIRTIFN